MKAMALEQLRQLAGTLTVLHGRVREAVAGEVGKAVADGVSEVLTAALGGKLIRHATRVVPPYRPPGYGRSDWEDHDERYWDDGRGEYPAPDKGTPDPSPEAALVVAMTAGRWRLARRGTSWGAAGVGVATAVALLTGGPVARTTVGVLWAIQKLVAATDALGDGAKSLDRL